MSGENENVLSRSALGHHNNADHGNQGNDDDNHNNIDYTTAIDDLNGNKNNSDNNER